MFCRISPALWGSVLSVALLAGAAPARAQSDENRTAARSLAIAGAGAFKEGRFQDAVDMFTKAESLLHAPTHLLYQARANAKLGHLVKAREAYLKIIKEELPSNAPEAFRSAQAAANRELPAIEPRIGRLTIKVVGANSAKDLALTLDGQPIPAVLVGIAQPIDPGTHTIGARATGMRAAPQQVTVHDAERLETTLTLEADPNAVAKTAAAGATPVIASTTASTEAAPAASTPIADAGRDTTNPESSNGRDGHDNKGMRIGAYVGFGVGAVGVGLGTVFLIQSLGKKSDAKSFCAAEAAKFNLAGGACPSVDRDHFESLNSSAKATGMLSIVGYGVGAAGIATGAILFVLSGHQEKAETAAGIHPWVGLNSIGAYGRF